MKRSGLNNRELKFHEWIQLLPTRNSSKIFLDNSNDSMLYCKYNIKHEVVTMLNLIMHSKQVSEIEMRTKTLLDLAKRLEFTEAEELEEHFIKVFDARDFLLNFTDTARKNMVQ